MNIKNDIPDHNVTVQWVENGQLKKVPLTPGHSAVYQSQLLVSMMGFIRISAFTDRFIPARVNGNLFFDMEPRDDEEFIDLSITPRDADSSSSSSSSSNSSTASGQAVTPYTQPTNGSELNSSDLAGQQKQSKGYSSPEQQQQQVEEHPSLSPSLGSHHLNPIFTNVGTKTVTFKFPPTGGKLITLRPYETVHLSMSQKSPEKPDDMVVEFTEEGQDSQYTATLPWLDKPTNVTVSVGTGKAVIDTNKNSSSPSTTGESPGSSSQGAAGGQQPSSSSGGPSSPKTYHMSPAFANTGTQPIKFRFPASSEKMTELPVHGKIMATLSQKSSTKPANMTINFEEGDKSYSAVLPWMETPNPYTVSAGNGQAVVAASNGDDGGSSDGAGEGQLPSTPTNSSSLGFVPITIDGNATMSKHN